MVGEERITRGSKANDRKVVQWVKCTDGVLADDGRCQSNANGYRRVMGRAILTSNGQAKPLREDDSQSGLSQMKINYSLGFSSPHLRITTPSFLQSNRYPIDAGIFVWLSCTLAHPSWIAGLVKIQPFLCEVPQGPTSLDMICSFSFTLS